MKRIVIATIISTVLLASPVAQAASNQDRAMATGAVIGATAGGVVGASRNQALEGAIFGAVLGTIAGAVIASNSQPVYVAPQRPHYQPVRHYKPSRHYKTVRYYKGGRKYRPVVRQKLPTATYKRSGYKHKKSHVRKVVHVQTKRQSSVRYVASRSRGHEHEDRD